MKKEKCTAVILAAGTGSRMKAGVPKQFLELGGRPLIYYALAAAEKSDIIDECILVTGQEDLEKMQYEIVETYGFQKVKAVIPGGSERCYSVAAAMRWIASQGEPEGYIFIHDGARPFLTEEILQRCFDSVRECRACVAAMPSKDTVKLVDEEGYAAETPDRSRVWTVQTPQVFEAKLITEAYAIFEVHAKEECAENHVSGFDKDAQQTGSTGEKIHVTDDASVVELFTDVRVKMTEGAYTNLKVTTPEDLVIAQALLDGIKF